MRKKIFKNIEWGILICTILLILIGLVALFSATQNAEYEELKKQIMWLCISIPIFIVVIFIDYEIVAKASPIFYGIFLILLIAVLFTKSINGATSWFNIGSFSIQPSEFAKIFVILVFAKVVSKIEERGKKEISRPTRLSLALAVVAVPVALIVIQPDYGTALAFLVATVMILYTAGIDKKYIITSILLVVILLPILYFFVLPDHAKTRIDVFLNPNLDPRGSGYNIIQSKLAIGAGELFGMGVLKGNQTQLGFLYPKTTDFIYISHGREYRNDNRFTTNNRSATTICKLWRKLNANKLNINSSSIKHKWQKAKNNICRIEFTQAHARDGPFRSDFGTLGTLLINNLIRMAILLLIGTLFCNF